ncbi:BPTI/Kunitz domain-containing protein-like [Ornithodoros turicata]|uniref:BPTI/Kunitz domain-containing protein-like n=1 Tax=Ornithodoros turicata TaxID=34597 RepID=UPI00313A32F4
MFHPLLSVVQFLLLLFARCGCNEIPIIVVGDESSEEIPDSEAEYAAWETCHTEHSSGTACRGAVSKTMFYHEPRTKKCTPFTFLGCGGNDNKFDTRLQCKIFCKVRPRGRCGEEKKEGSCKAIIPRYYFDWKTWQCLSFDFGGCEGNKNNFLTQEQCQRRCKRQRTNGSVNQRDQRKPAAAFQPRLASSSPCLVSHSLQIKHTAIGKHRQDLFI